MASLPEICLKQLQKMQIGILFSQNCGFKNSNHLEALLFACTPIGFPETVCKR